MIQFPHDNWKTDSKMGIVSPPFQIPSSPPPPRDIISANQQQTILQKFIPGKRKGWWIKDLGNYGCVYSVDRGMVIVFRDETNRVGSRAENASWFSNFPRVERDIFFPHFIFFFRVFHDLQTPHSTAPLRPFSSRRPCHKTPAGQHHCKTCRLK